MRILEIEMENVRGIRKKISLTPKGENLVIHGPNGTGRIKRELTLQTNSTITPEIKATFTANVVKHNN